MMLRGYIVQNALLLQITLSQGYLIHPASCAT